MPDLSLSQNQSVRLQQEQRLSQEQRLGLTLLQKDIMSLQTEIKHQLLLNPVLAEIQAPCLIYGNEIQDFRKTDGTPTQTEREMDEDAGEYHRRLLEQATERVPDERKNVGETPEADVPFEDSRIEPDEDIGWGERSQATWDVDDDERRNHFFDSISREPSYSEQLMNECDLSIDGTPEFKEICRKLCNMLNNAGYLEDDDETLCQVTGASPEELHRAIETLQNNLDPAGIGARTLQECLLIQLRRKRLVGSIEWDIISDHLEDLEHNRLPKIAKEMGFDLDEIKDAVMRIGDLNPKPGYELYCETAPIVIPDVFVEKDEEGKWRVRGNSASISQLALDANLVRLLDDEYTNAETKKFLREKINEATMLIHAIDQREATLIRIVLTFISLQPKFFETGRAEDLLPLTGERVADLLQLSPPTISKAIGGKYMQTPWGVLSFKSFFSNGYRSESGEQVSSIKVRQRIKEIIAAEDPRHPISDQDISDKLLQEGFTVKRRTIAKYRDLEGIPTTSQRRLHE